MRPSLISRQGGLAESPLGTCSRGKRERTQEKSTKNRFCARSEGGAEGPGGWNLDSGQHPFSQERKAIHQVQGNHWLNNPSFSEAQVKLGEQLPEKQLPKYPFSPRHLETPQDSMIHSSSTCCVMDQSWPGPRRGGIST